MTTLLDASALLALINEEPGMDFVAEALEDAVLSTVNVAEVAGKLREVGWESGDIAEFFTDLNVPILPFSIQDALFSGDLRPYTRSLGLSLADRACLATAVNKGYAVLTADQAWRGVEIKGVDVRFIREQP